MKKNIIIGVLSSIIIVMALFSYFQKTNAAKAKIAAEHAESDAIKAQKVAVECRQQAHEQMVLAQEEKVRAEMANMKLNEALQSALLNTDKPLGLPTTKK